jgi:PTS system nitrogen regulatory IIA component
MEEGMDQKIKLADYISLNRILFCSAETKQGVIDELIAVSEKDGVIANVRVFKDALLNRERIMSTGIGYGVAIPHVKLSGIDEFFVTVGVHKRGVDWDSLDSKPVHLLFLISGPDNRQERYLRILARLTMVIKDPSRRERIPDFKTKFELFELLHAY